MRSRPFLTRLVLAGAGMGVLGLGVYVGLGYAVREHRPWVVRVLGEVRCYELRMAYARVLAGAFPQDSDGDYFPDSVEDYFGASAHPRAGFVSRRQGVMPLDSGSEAYVFDTPSYFLQPGERRRVRARISYGERLDFSPGMQLRLNWAGGVYMQWPELLPVGTDGSFEFDLAIPSDGKGDTWIMAVHPISGTSYGGVIVDIVWKLPPVVCTVEEVALDDDMRFHVQHLARGKAKVSVVRLTWPRVENAGRYYVEAMDEEVAGGGAEEGWFPVRVCGPDVTTCLLGYRYGESWAGREGRLKFRVVPSSK
jgi:hypothetical protein